jgi:predicted MFS family arabinose efflux permease
VALALAAVDGVELVGAVGFALAGQFALALSCLWLLTTATGPHMSLRQVWINQHTDSSVRATVFSLASQVTALAAIVGAPVVGAAATAYGTRPALALGALILAPAALLYLWSATSDRSDRAPESESKL